MIGASRVVCERGCSPAADEDSSCVSYLRKSVLRIAQVEFQVLRAEGVHDFDRAIQGLAVDDGHVVDANTHPL